MLLTIKTPYTCMEFQVTSMQARQLIDEAYQMAVSTLNEEDSNNPLFCPPFDLPDVSEFDEAQTIQNSLSVRQRVKTLKIYQQ